MVDSELRRLERRAAETHSLEDEAAWILARIRSGLIESRRVELAAHAGHAPSAWAIGGSCPAPTTWRGLRTWAEQLSAFGADAAVRAGLADAEQWGRIVQAPLLGEKRLPVRAHDSLDAHVRLIRSRLDALTAWALA